MLEYASKIGNVSRACRYFGVSRESYYQWKRTYETNGEDGLANQAPCLENPALRISKEVEDKVIQLRKTFHFGPQRIASYLESHYQIRVSRTSCYNILLRHGLNRIAHAGPDRPVLAFSHSNTGKSGHQVRINVRQISIRDKTGNRLRKFQYAAIDKRTQAKIVKVVDDHTVINAVRFVDYVIRKLPSHVSVIQTMDDREFQGWYHRHIEGLGIKHISIKTDAPDTDREKVERSGASVDQVLHQKTHQA